MKNIKDLAASTAQNWGTIAGEIDNNFRGTSDDIRNDVTYVRGLDASNNPIKISKADLATVVGRLLPVASNESKGVLSTTDYRFGVNKVFDIDQFKMYQLTGALYRWQKYFIDFEYATDDWFGKVVLFINTMDDINNPMISLINIKNGLSNFPYTIYKKDNQYYARRDGVSLNGSCSISSVSNNVYINTIGIVEDVSSYTKLTLTVED